MFVKKLKITVKSPFYYYTHGGVFAGIGDFIGDIAIFYALSYALKGLEFPIEDKRIEHIKSSDFIVTVGYPISLKMKKVLIVASTFKDALHMFKDVYAKAGGSNPYKNIRRIKPIDVNSVYISYFISKNEYALPKTFGLRIGVNRDGIIEVRTLDSDPNDVIWLNIYTLRAKGIPDEEIMRIVSEVTAYNRFYIVAKNVKLSDFLSLISKYL